MQRQRIRFTGRVQGVGFRMTARGVARGFAVTGWVRNEADGSVLMEAQGLKAEVEGFVGQLMSEMGRLIEGADRREAPVVEGETDFEVRR